MKVFLRSLAVSIVLPMAVSAQVATGGTAAGGSSAAAGARSAGVAASGAVSPTGSLAGQRPTAPGVVAPATTAPVGAPGTTVPVGPVNPAPPPQTVGRTFDRSTIAGPPSDTSVNPAATQPTLGFPPANTLPQPTLPNTGTGAGGFPAPGAFPPGPVGVNNTVGAAAREPVTVNLPPGARISTNVVGVPEVVVPPPAIVGTNVGRPPGSLTGTNRSVVVPAVPPPQTPRVTRGPILDSRTQQ